MIEKILFKKVELWIILSILLLVIIGSLPSIVKDILTDDTPKCFQQQNCAADYVSDNLVSVYELETYRRVFEKKTNGPIYFAKKGLSDVQPLIVQSRINVKGDEIFAIFDEKRNLVKTIPLEVESIIKDIPSRIGASTHHFFDDGSYIIFPYGGVGLFRLDSCGNTIWEQEGMYHHHYSIADNKLYILGLPSNEIDETDVENWNHSDILNIIDIDTGKILKSISIEEIARVNLPSIDPFFFENWKDLVNAKGVLNTDLLHLNKIEVLPDSIRKQYPSLPAKALMVSARNINLIFIMDPETLEIIWYSHGNTQVQHDPEFIGDNKIAVFNNSNDENHPDKTHPSNYTNIKTYDFNTQKWQTLYNAKLINGYTEHSGNFYVSKNGSLALNLNLQGRLVELDPNEEVLFEFISYKDDNSVFWMKDAQYLSQSAYNSIISKPCN